MAGTARPMAPHAGAHTLMRFFLIFDATIRPYVRENSARVCGPPPPVGVRRLSREAVYGAVLLHFIYHSF